MEMEKGYLMKRQWAEDRLSILNTLISRMNDREVKIVVIPSGERMLVSGKGERD